MKLFIYFKSIFLSTLLFFSLFVGNAKINEIFIFYFIFFLVYLTIYLYKDKSFFIQIDFFTFLILGIFFIQNIYSNEFFEYENYEYYFWPLNAFILYMISLIYNKELNNKIFLKASLFIFIIYIYIFIIPSIFDIIFLGTNRFSFIFGPNMYYRVLSILLIIILYLIYRINYKSSINIFLFLILPYSIAILHTGSRGALFMLVIVWIYFSSNFIKLRKQIVLIIMILSISLIGLLFILMDIELTSRVVLLDYQEGSSIGIRLSAYIYLYENFMDYLLSFGITQHRFELLLGGVHFHYPHNIFLELIYYYGIFGIISVICIHFILLKIFISLKKIQKYNYIYLYYILLLLLFASSFSGDFSDNYPFISVLLLLLRVFFQPIKKNKNKIL